MKERLVGKEVGSCGTGNLEALTKLCIYVL